MLIDTHAHLDTYKTEELDSVIRRAVDAGVKRIITVGIDEHSNRKALETVRQYPGVVSAVIGYDRDQAKKIIADIDVEHRMNILEKMIAANAGQVVGIGEIGLDFHYMPASPDKQIALFQAQLELARNMNLPVVIHSREAEEKTAYILEQHSKEWKGAVDRIGVIHSFTGNKDFALKMAKSGFYISFSGIMTFKRSVEIREALRSVPKDKILLETDAPYLAPEPYRGKRNEPGLLVHTARKAAEEIGISYEEIAGMTTTNASRLFAFV